MVHHFVSQTPKIQVQDTGNSPPLNLSRQQVKNAIADLKQRVHQLNQDAKATLQLVEDPPPPEPSQGNRREQLQQLTARAIALRQRAERWHQNNQKSI